MKHFAGSPRRCPTLLGPRPSTSSSESGTTACSEAEQAPFQEHIGLLMGPSSSINLRQSSESKGAAGSALKSSARLERVSMTPWHVLREHRQELAQGRRTLSFPGGWSALHKSGDGSAAREEPNRRPRTFGLRGRPADPRYFALVSLPSVGHAQARKDPAA